MYTNGIRPYWVTETYEVILIGTGEELDKVAPWLPTGLKLIKEIEWENDTWTARVICEQDEIPLVEEWLALIKLTS